MISFDQLTIQGFKSYRLEQRIDLRRGEHGLYLVLGRNDVNPELGSNAVGKSSMWAALCWVIYGKDPRGLKAKDTASWQDEEASDYLCRSTLTFRIDDVPYRLARTWSPNSLVLTKGEEAPRAVEQHEVDQLICEYSVFLCVVLLGQFNSLFFDLSATEKLEIFSDALDLDNWVQASERAKKEVKEALTEVEEQERLAASSAGKLEALREQRKELKERLLDLARDTEARTAALMEKEKEVRKLTDSLEDRSADLKHRLRASSEAREQEQRKLGELDEAVRRAKTELTILDRVDETLAAERRKLDKRLHEVEHAQGCPWCKQEISEAQSFKLIALVNKEFTTLAQREKESKADREKWTSKHFAARKALEQSSKACETLEEVHSSLVDEARELNQKTMVAIGKQEQIGSELKSLTLRKIEEQTTSKGLLEKIKATKSQLEEVTSSVEEKRRLASLAEFWVSGFKELRLWIIDQALDELETYANNALIELGLKEWKIQFKVERQSQAGGLIKGFHVEILPPTATEPVPWIGYSGGETQRLRIAGALGLAALIRTRRGFNCSLEVWDEPTAHLAPEGVDDLVRFFAQRAREEDKHVWLVENRPIDSGEFAGQVLIVKGAKGSTIIQSRRKGTRNELQIRQATGRST